MKTELLESNMWDPALFYIIDWALFGVVSSEIKESNPV